MHVAQAYGPELAAMVPGCARVLPWDGVASVLEAGASERRPVSPLECELRCLTYAAPLYLDVSRTTKNYDADGNANTYPYGGETCYWQSCDDDDGDWLTVRGAGLHVEDGARRSCAEEVAQRAVESRAD